MQTPGGAFAKAERELWTNLGMAPNRPRSAAGSSRRTRRWSTSRRYPRFPRRPAASRSRAARWFSRTNTIFRPRGGLIGAGTGADVRNRFRISVDGGPFVDVDLSPIDFSAAPLNAPTNIQANLGSAIAARIDPLLAPGSAVTVTFENGPDGQSGADNEDTSFLRIASANGDVAVEPAAADDLAVPLRLGAAQGGLCVGLAAFRPAPNGIVLDATDARAARLRRAHAGRVQCHRRRRPWPIVPSLVTTTGVTNPRMFQVGETPRR